MTALIAVVLAGEVAYPVDDEPPAAADDDVAAADDGVAGMGGGPVDWREFLDLAEQVGGRRASPRCTGSTSSPMPRPTSSTPATTPWRSTSRWPSVGSTRSPPVVLREAMARWQFDSVAGLVADADAALDVRDDLVFGAEPLALVPVDELEQQYQDADEIEPVTDVLADHLAAAERLAGR